QDARSSLLRSAQLAASPLGGLTPADVPLIEAEILSEQPGPPHHTTESRLTITKWILELDVLLFEANLIRLPREFKGESIHNEHPSVHRLLSPVSENIKKTGGGGQEQPAK
ncbi:MAG: hypothetical protein WBX25_15170, partial [Rhodomicrobium sp.]